MNDAPQLRTGPMRWVLLVLGFLFVGLGGAGAFLPVLPTTPFLLLAAACFVRTSPRFHAKLLENRTFGPYIRQWQKDRTVPLHAKRKAYTVVVLTFAISIYVVDALWLRLLLVGIGGSLLLFLRCLPTTQEP